MDIVQYYHFFTLTFVVKEQQPTNKQTEKKIYQRQIDLCHQGIRTKTRIKQKKKKNPRTLVDKSPFRYDISFGVKLDRIKMLFSLFVTNETKHVLIN